MLTHNVFRSRREVLQVGALAGVGLALPDLLRGQARARESTVVKPRAKACILFFLEGGPSHIDLWDMKPAAPAEVRGEFKPIATHTPGIQVCEHLPLMSRQIHRLAQVRSVHHHITDHNAGSYYSLTGKYPVDGGKLIVAEAPKNFPCFGAVLAKLRPSGRALPDFVHIPEMMSNNGFDIPGESAGFLGAKYDPFITGDPSLPGYAVPGMTPQVDVALDRLRMRDELLRQLDSAGRRTDDAAAFTRRDVFQKRALQLIGSAEVRRAFDLSAEPLKLRERYGVEPGSDRALEARKFGGLPHLGQCLLMARRLIEAGVRLVTVVSGRRIDQAWDTHRDHFPLLKRSLLPMFDRSFSALLEDMSERGLLDETLIVALGEFGRTPKLGYVTSAAGAAKNGRDHWPYCYTVFLGGAGIPPGAVIGASDKQAAYPARDPVVPEDIAATIYACLGISPETELRDALGKPSPLATGRVLTELLQ